MSRPSRGAARLAAILDALPDALLLVNCNGTVVNANTIALEAFEAPGTALVGRGLLDLLPEFDSKRIPGSMRRPDEAAAELEQRQLPTRMIARRTDGTEMPVEVTSALLEDGRTPYASAFEAAFADHGPGSGNSYTGDELLMLVVRDLTGTLDTEAELARQQRQTEMILRAASEGVIGVDTEGVIVLVNPAAAQMLGYRAGDLGGQELHGLLMHSRPDGSALPYEETTLSDTLKSGRKHRVRAGHVLWAKDGQAVPVDITTAPVRDGEQLVGAVVTFSDRRAYEALAGRHEQLLAVLQDSLRGPLDQLREELGGLAADPAGQLWPEANQILHHLAAGYTRMTTLVDNVLAYQRLDAGREKLQREVTSLDGVVANGVEAAIELIGPGRAQFAVHAPPIEAEVDGERLSKALAHLIADVAGVDATGNAPAVAPGVDTTIVVAAAQRGDVVRIEVRGPYAGGDPVHLPIVRGTVERHGGVLQTHEVPGAGGSAYVLEVPLKTDGEAVALGGGAVSGGAAEQGAATQGGGAGVSGAAVQAGGGAGETTVMPMPAQPVRGTGAEAQAQANGAPAGAWTGTGDMSGAAPAAGIPDEFQARHAQENGDGASGAAGHAAPTGRRRGRPSPEETGQGQVQEAQVVVEQTGSVLELPPASADAGAAGVPGTGAEDEQAGAAQLSAAQPGTGRRARRSAETAEGGQAVPVQAQASAQGDGESAGAGSGQPGGRRARRLARAKAEAESNGQGTQFAAGSGQPLPSEGQPGQPVQAGQPVQPGQAAPGPQAVPPPPAHPPQVGVDAAANGGAPGAQPRGNQPQPVPPQGVPQQGLPAQLPAQADGAQPQLGPAQAQAPGQVVPSANGGQPQSAPAQGGPAGGGAPQNGLQPVAVPPQGQLPAQGHAPGQGGAAANGTPQNGAQPQAAQATAQAQAPSQGQVPGQPVPPQGQPGQQLAQADGAQPQPQSSPATARAQATGQGVPAQGQAPAQDGSAVGVPQNGAQPVPAQAQPQAFAPADGAQGQPEQVPAQSAGQPQAPAGESSAQPEAPDAEPQPEPAPQHSVVAASPILAGGGPLPESQQPRGLPMPGAPSAEEQSSYETGHHLVQTLGQGVPITPGMAERAQGPQTYGGQSLAHAPNPVPHQSHAPSASPAIPSTPSTPPGSGKRRKLATPARDGGGQQTQGGPVGPAGPGGLGSRPAQRPGARPATRQGGKPGAQARARTAQAPGGPGGPGGGPGTGGPGPGVGTQQPQQPPQPQNPTPAREFSIGAPAADGAEGPEPLDGPNSPVEMSDGRGVPTPPPSAVDAELPPEPLDNPRRLLVWPEPDAATQQLLSAHGYRPVIVHSREEVDAQIAAYPAALFVDPLTGPITRTALQSLRTAAVAAEVPVMVTAGLGQATRDAAYGADPAVLFKALAPRDSEQHPPRVLLCEERPPIAGALRASLERRGIQVAHAPTDEAAVNVAAQMRPNLVVLDLMQVRMQRAGILDWLRVNGLLSRTPIVVYSSDGMVPGQLPLLATGQTVLYLAERSTRNEVQQRIVDLLTKIGTN